MKLSKGTLIKRGDVWQVNFRHQGKQIRRSTKETDIDKALIVAEKFAGLFFNNLTKREGKPRVWYPTEYSHPSWAAVVDEGLTNWSSWLRLIHRRAKTRAEIKNKRNFSINLEEIKTLALATEGYCSVSGLPFTWERPNNCNMPPFAPSLDRIDSRRGYELFNCRFVCCGVNLALSDWGDATLIKIAHAITAKR